MKWRKGGYLVTRKFDILKMRSLSNQGNILRGMTSAFGVVVGVGMDVGVGDGGATNGVAVRKERYGSVIGYKERR